MEQSALWSIAEHDFNSSRLHHQETIFTIGNGYLSTRGAFEEGYPGDWRATFVHGVFDAAPVVFTELANTPDWLPFPIYLNGERFSLHYGVVDHFERSLDLRTGVLTRTVHWRTPSGYAATITYERFTSLADPHTMLVRCRVTPEFEGFVEFRPGLKGDADNMGVAHWRWVEQGQKGEAAYMLNETRQSKIRLAIALRWAGVVGSRVEEAYWDVENAPTGVIKMDAVPAKTLIVDKFVAIATSRDSDDPVETALKHVNDIVDWASSSNANAEAWEAEWARSDVSIEGDDEAQRALRFNLFQMLIAAPRHEDTESSYGGQFVRGVNIGAKTLSGFGYRGHSFWDTEIFMLPLFIYTAPQLARKLLDYRYHRLPAARANARGNGYEGAQFPWESADTGEEVTPRWVPHYSDPTQLVRIWTGDIEIHISADVTFGAYQYWQVSGDDQWMIDRGVEIILDTAKFWATRAEWNAETGRYEYNDVIGPDEYHEHVDNNAFTNRMAQWNLQTGLEMLDWLRSKAASKAAALIDQLDLSERRLAHWREVIEKIWLNIDPKGLIEQFEGYYQRREVDLAAMEPRDKSVQVIFGIEGCNETQVLKQPDVLILLHLLRQHYSDDILRTNYNYYTPRTDHTYGSSLGPSIQAIVACEVGRPDDAYEHFLRAVRADLHDARGNANDGIHAASAAGTWQAVVFGFAGLRVSPKGWSVTPRLPKGWRRIAFRFYHRGQLQDVEVKADS